MIPRYAAPSPNSVLVVSDYYKGSCSMRKEEDAPVALSFHVVVEHGDQQDSSSSCDDQPVAVLEEEEGDPTLQQQPFVAESPLPPAATRTKPPQSPRSVVVLDSSSGTETSKEDSQVRTNTTIRSGVQASSCTISSSKKTPAHPPKKHVSWGWVHVRRHAILPGDHPDARGGPPLSIEWTALSERQVPLDQFEWEREPHRAHSSHAHQELVLTPEFRYELLRRNGARDVDIVHSLWQSVRTHTERAETVRDLKFGGWHEFTENVQRFFQFPRPPPVLQTKY